MDENKLDFFRNELELKKREILDEAGKTMGEMTDQTTNIPDPNDRASIESGRSFELRIRGRERKLLSKIDEAIADLEAMLSEEPSTGPPSLWLTGLFDRVQRHTTRAPEDDWTAAMLVPREVGDAP